jgi:hypothetical protein
MLSFSLITISSWGGIFFLMALYPSLSHYESLRRGNGAHLVLLVLLLRHCVHVFFFSAAAHGPWKCTQVP